MGSEVESGLEDILKTLLEQLQAACGIFERIVYKNKNQHRGCSYFQYLLKMVELILKAATEVSILLARSFFMEFSMAVLALLALLRVLVRQILLNVASLSNTVSSLAQNKQSVKINKKGIEVFREYYPTNKEFITLECVWEGDKFVLLERVQKTDVKENYETIKDPNNGRTAIRYRSIQAFLREITDDGGDIEKMEVDHPDKEGSSLMKKDEDLSAGSPTPKEIEHQKQGNSIEMGDDLPVGASPGKGINPNATSSASPDATTSIPNSSSSRQVTFVSV